MRKFMETLLWVVYRMTIHGKASGMNAVCEQSEWDAMERAQPGRHTLVQAGIANEAEAERLARSVPTDVDTSKASPAELRDL
jgi:hypothetical protein